MKLKLSKLNPLISQSNGYETQVTVKVCRPLVILNSVLKPDQLKKPFSMGILKNLSY